MSRAEFYRMVSAAIQRAMAGLSSDPYAQEGVIAAAREREHSFAEHNEKFDAARFRRDCGIE